MEKFLIKIQMKTKYQIQSLFSTPLYINEIPKQLILDHIELLDNETILGEEDNVLAQKFGSRSKNSYILNQSPYQNLHNYILQHVTHFAENYMSYNYKDYKFSQSWISIKNPGETHYPHTHPHSLISGVFFYGESNNNTSSIEFHRNDDISKTINNHKMKPQHLLNDFSYTSYKIIHKSGILVIFPSCLTHSVSTNKTNIPRKSLSFNVVPKSGLGAENLLTELKF